MRVLHKSIYWLLRQRLRSLQGAIAHPIATQMNLLQQLLQQGRHTVYGQQFNYQHIKTYQAFQEQVPLCNYEQLYPYIEQTIKGQKNVLWPTPIKWFAKSSGTTNDRSKFIPVSAEALQAGHYKAGKDMLALYLANYPASNLLKGKSLAIGGTLYPNQLCTTSSTQYGDISAVIMQNLPYWARWVRTPKLDIALLANLEEKFVKLVQATRQENITALIGVPTWILLLLNTVLASQQAAHIHMVWPSLELFIHGGISFEPYKELFSRITFSEKMNYMEVYNASEGFFAIQDQPAVQDMLLLVNHGVYYEFIPIEEIDSTHPKVLDLAQVELDKIYALVITTNAGLWRYQIGDTVKFTSLAPYRIKIAGRTKHFINTFGEELLIHNAEAAMAHACRVTGATIRDYTAGPVYTTMQQQGCHEWIIEFVEPPADLPTFVEALDQELQTLNSDYEAKRFQDLVLAPPRVVAVPQGVFYTWLKKQDKIGEQHKVPRLFNSRKYLDDIHQFLAEAYHPPASQLELSLTGRREQEP